MSGHFAFETQPRSQVPSDEDGRVCPEDDLALYTLPQPGIQAQHHRPWHPSNPTANDSSISGREIGPQRERTANMDILTHKLSNSHLRLDGNIPPPLSRYSASACPSVTSLDLLTEDPCCRTSSPHAPSRRTTNLSASLTTEPDPVRHSHNVKQDVRRLRRKPSSRFLNLLNEAEGSSAIQTRVEGMVSAGTQCNVYQPSLVPVVPIEADDYDGMDCEVGATSLEIDDGDGDDAPGIPLIDKLLSLRRASGTLGIRKNGFPLYRSSTDTALRCQNLVRNKPRMRRRKGRQKPSPSTMSADEA